MDAFRKLRNLWFRYHLESKPSDFGAMEDEVGKSLREKQNRELRERFDIDTEKIIQGEDRPIAPRCSADLDRG